jgi:hypothetical protein
MRRQQRLLAAVTSIAVSVCHSCWCAYMLMWLVCRRAGHVTLRPSGFLDKASGSDWLQEEVVVISE